MTRVGQVDIFPVVQSINTNRDAMKKKSATSLRHCSKCGKFSKNKSGEYTRRDGSAGYINQEEGEAAPVCSDCRDLEETNGE